MSIFTVDHREHKNDMLAAIEQYKKDQNFETIMEAIEEFRAAIVLKPDFVRHCQRFVMANSLERLAKLINVIDDHELRRWIRWPILVVLFPFIFIYRIIYRIIKMGLP